jgi:hypothetical protein
MPLSCFAELYCFNEASMLNGSLVTVACHILRLQMEKMASWNGD